MNNSVDIFRSSLLGAAMLALPLPAVADADYDALKAQVKALQQQLQDVQAAMRQYEQNNVTRQEVAQLKQDVADATERTSEWGATDSSAHLAGYAAVTYSDEGNGVFSGVQFNPIFHYQYKNLLLLESELELAVAEDGSTELALEYLTLDVFLNDYLAVVAGKFLSPLGQFRQNLHPAWINKLTSAPPGFGHDQAAPVSETGLQARGGFPLGGQSRFGNYAVYVSNGPILEIEGDEIEAVEAEGRTSNDDGRYVFGGRVGVLPIPELEIGLSGASGDVAGEDEPALARSYTVYGADVAWHKNNLRVIGEYVKQKVAANLASVAPEAASWEAWYVQGSYRFLPSRLEGVLRYGEYDTPHDSLDQTQVALGANYVFAPNAMAKFTYHFNDGQSGSTADKDRLEVQFAYGF